MITHNDIGSALALKKLRKDLGKKQFDIAQDLGLKDQRELSNYELAKKHFSDEFIHKISSVFGVTEDEFKKFANRLKNYKPSPSEVSVSKVQKIKPTLVDYKIKLLLYRKENVELQLKNIRLEQLLCEAQSKLKSLRFDNATENIYVAI